MIGLAWFGLVPFVFLLAASGLWILGEATIGRRRRRRLYDARRSGRLEALGWQGDEPVVRRSAS